MRVTKLLLTKEEQKQIELLTDEITSVNKDITLAYDFSKDAYTLFKEKVNRRHNFKSFWQLFKDIKDQYTIYKIGNKSEEHTSELQSHSFISYAVFCLKKKK